MRGEGADERGRGRVSAEQGNKTESSDENWVIRFINRTSILYVCLTSCLGRQSVSISVSPVSDACFTSFADKT